MRMFDEYQQLIRDACSRVYEVASETPLDYADQISRQIHNRVWLKREDQQPVFSYKVRGAYNLMAILTTEEKRKGVVAASAGNHAQGVALAAQRLGTSALIVMPKTTPEIKISAVRRLKDAAFEAIREEERRSDAGDQGRDRAHQGGERPQRGRR